MNPHRRRRKANVRARPHADPPATKIKTARILSECGLFAFPRSGSGLNSVGDKGQQSGLTGAFDRGSHFSLMLGAGAGHTAGQDLGTLGNELSEFCGILIINEFHLVCAEDADLSSSVHGGTGRTRRIISFHGYDIPF